MTILLSYNEIQSTVRKAAMGAGLPHGAAEEVGDGAVWLSARGLDAVSAVVEALADGEGCSAILEGLSAIDALCCGLGTIPLHEEPSALVLVGLAGAATERGAAFVLDRGNGEIVSLAQTRDARGLLLKPAALCLARDGGRADGGAGTPRPAATAVAAYAAALALAARTYVPASELSRTLGAGAGTTDND